MFYDYLLDFGYSKDEILKMVEREPDIVSLREEEFYNKINLLINLKYNKVDVKKMILLNPSILKMADIKITDIIYTLVGLGYNYDSVIMITSKFSLIFNMKEKDIILRYNDLMMMGYNTEETNEITIKNPNLYGYGYDPMREKFDYLKEYGYPINYIKKIFNNFDYINVISLFDLKLRIKDLSLLGFTTEDIINITYKQPQIFLFRYEYIMDKIKYFVSIGYSYTNILTMIKINPNILICSDDKLNEIIKVFKKYNYTLKEIITITLNCPYIYNNNVMDVAIKLEFFKQIRMSKYLLEEPMLLVRGIDLAYARYLYLNSVGVKINKNNINILFVGDNYFSKFYDVTKEELLYNYENNEENPKLKTLSIRRLLKK